MRLALHPSPPHSCLPHAQTFTDKHLEMLQCTELVGWCCCPDLAAVLTVHAAAGQAARAGHLRPNPSQSAPPQAASKCCAPAPTPCPAGLQEELARGQRQLTEQIYEGTYPWHPYRPLKETVPQERASLATFKWVASMVSSWLWSFGMLTQL